MTERLDPNSLVEIGSAPETKPENYLELPDIVNRLKYLGPELSQTERTHILEDGHDKHIIISAYCPGQGEEIHTHPTGNTLTILSGVFKVSAVNPDGQELIQRCEAGTVIKLAPEQPHHVQACPNLDQNSVIMVEIIPGKPTSDPDYSTPWPKV